MLLCGRSCLLHRGVGRCELSTSCLYLSRWHYFTLYQGILQDIAARWGRFFCCSECGLLCGLGNGWPATGGAWVLAGSRCKAGNKVGFAPCNSLAGGWWGPGNWSPWELRRCDPLRGIGLMGYVAKCKRGGVVLCHVFKYRKGPAPTC